MNLAQDIAALPTLSVSQLRLRYAEIFGEITNAAHKGWLVKRIAWRLQALAEGDLSERARQRAAELACAIGRGGDVGQTRQQCGDGTSNRLLRDAADDKRRGGHQVASLRPFQRNGQKQNAIFIGDELRFAAVDGPHKLAAKQVIAARLLDRGVEQFSAVTVPESERGAEHFPQGGGAAGQLRAVIHLERLRCNKFLISAVAGIGRLANKRKQER